MKKHPLRGSLVRLAPLLFLAWASAISASADGWNLPAQLTANDAKLTFSVETTWHTVHGTSQQISGKIWLEHPEDYKSVHLEGSVPVAALETGSTSRDEEMRDSMGAPQFSQIGFSLISLTNICPPDSITATNRCAIDGSVSVTIRGVSKTVPFSGQISRSVNGNLVVATTTRLHWPDFGMRDPSIFVARVHPDVDVHLEINLKNLGQNG